MNNDDGDKPEWVPEDIERLERYAKALEDTTAGTVGRWTAFDLTLVGFTFRRAVIEMRRAREAGFKP